MKIARYQSFGGNPSSSCVVFEDAYGIPKNDPRNVYFVRPRAFVPKPEEAPHDHHSRLEGEDLQPPD